MEPILPQPGSTPAPSAFVGRTMTTMTARRDLRAGNNLALTDPRRMGKTFWMRYFCHITTDFIPVFIDYEGVQTSEQFLLRTAEALGRHEQVPKAAQSRFRGFFEGLGAAGLSLDEVGLGPVKVRVGVQGLSASELLHQCVRAIEDHPVGLPFLICMDEVPLAVRNIARREGAEAAGQVLQTLRELRGSLGSIRWIVAGSIGFHHVLRECAATEGDINDLDNLPLGPMPEEESIELARRLLLGIDRLPADESAIAALVDFSGGIPFLLHKYASMLHDNPGAGRVTAQEVQDTFEAFVDDRDESRAITHLLTRLDPNYGVDADLARTILDGTAAEPSSQSMESLSQRLGEESDRIGRVLDFLVDDHYLSRRGNTVAWRYDILRRIWVRRRWPAR